ncbi:PAS domain S-box protein [Curvibacter sp. APW13]|uniref:PAS domain-containing hybrid sensor histidine kinase/response regulator n=1 Tax=Curvibacter sp. APW13 TaxID=3077236 RepID=UPI0028DD939C|nr:PAS domain S-box protein [Curvibacter sp. APW13]MDT8990505.1 PAS domain S-box protein [Curvibacter sp. APW13]
MGLIRQFLPKTLVGRIFALYAATLLVFTCSGLLLFYRYQFERHVQEEVLAGEMMMNVAAPSVADSAVIGDYDTIGKTLERAIDRSPFSRAQFIDTSGGIIKAEQSGTPRWRAPDWLLQRLQEQLLDINHNIRVGGKDYGVMRLSFDVDLIAAQLWELLVLVSGLAAGATLCGMGLMGIPLKRWLGNFDRVRAHEDAILSGAVEVGALLDSDAPAEIRHTFEILSHAASSLAAQRTQASVILNAIADGVLNVGADLQIRNCNPAAQIMLGGGATDILGHPVSDWLPGLALPTVEALDWKLQRMELQGAQGRRTVIDVTISAIHSADGLRSGFVLALRDVTQQFLADQQLRSELQMRRRALDALQRILQDLDSAPAGKTPSSEPADLDALAERVAALMRERELGRRALDNQKFALDQHAIVSITDLQGTITYANDRFCAISGYSREELIGSNHRIVRSGVHDAAVFAGMWDTITRGQVWHGEICNRAKDGHAYWVAATIVPLLGLDGLPEQYIAIRTDITERKAVETKLAEQLGFVEVLLDATPTAIYLKDRHGHYLRFNRAFEELFGIERSQWIGKTVFDLVPGDAAQLMHEKDIELFAQDRVQTYEAQFTNRRTGAVRDGLYWKAPVKNIDGEITGLVGTILDVTERNRMAAELRESTLRAEAASQAKSDFLANMSHEIRTPMNGVIGMTELALDTELTAVQREYLRTVKNSAHSLMVILNDILDFSKIEAGKLSIESVAFAPRELVRDCLRSLQARAQAKGLRLDHDLPPGLPEQLLGDPVRIGQVLTNLCDNAVKFTAQGSITVTVTALPGAEAAHCLLQFSVRDSGIGIPADKQASIFEAFSQADTSTTRQYGGTGLGLTICARLVDLMGGRIWVESEPGAGSTFHFTVRLERPAARPTTSPVPGPAAANEAPANAPGLRILLVEDHPVNQKLAATILKKWGHEVSIAHNGQEGVEQAIQGGWDLVFMDMQMPVMGGIEATLAIRAHEAQHGGHVPIIAMTANAMDSDQQACLEAGMDDFVAKPFNVATVKAAMERVLPT